MKNRLPTALIVVAALQFLAPLCLPPRMLAGISPVVWLLAAALFVLLGVALLRRRAWARLATIFVQGFNILVRLLILMPNVATRSSAGKVTLDAPLLITFVISMLLSAVVLYYVDLPEVQMQMS